MGRKIIQKFSIIGVLAIIFTMVFSNTLSAFACTDFYLGGETTDSGSTIWGRSEEVDSTFSKLHFVHKAETHLPGDMWVSSSGFKWEYPAKTLRYTLVKDSINNEGNYPEPYSEVGMNEKNVAMTATVTIRVRNEIKGPSGEDPLVSSSAGGLTEEDMTSVVLRQATSARNAVELIAEIVDTVGAGGTEGLMIGDPNEIWYMQILSGHQYVAVKAPADKIGFTPNLIANVDLTDTANVISSPGLVTVPEDAGTLVKDSDGNIKIADSYQNEPTALNSRLWLLNNYLFDQAKADALTPTAHIDYFIQPRASKNYTLYEAMRLLAYRGEGTAYDANKPENSSMRAIGVDATVEPHIFETRKGMPDQLATIQWLAMGPAEFSVYLPSFANLITDTFEMYYQPDAAAYNDSDPDANSVYWVFRELYTLSKGPRGAADLGSTESRARYGDGVKAFWERYQKSLIEQQKDVDVQMAKILEKDGQAEAERVATELSKAVSAETYDYAKEILSELKAFQEAGTQGNFIPSALMDENALPNYTIDVPEENTPEGNTPEGTYESTPESPVTGDGATGYALLIGLMALMGMVFISKKEYNK